MNVTVIGGGAAGCFCAIQLRRLMPSVNVTVLEAGEKAMAKLLLTGGGRCNLSNSFESVRSLKEVYPRGWRLMERLFKTFGPDQLQDWFRAEGVPLVVEDAGRVFPASQDSHTVVSTLKRLMHRHGVMLRSGARVDSIAPGFEISLSGGETMHSDVVVVTSGGRSRGGRDMLEPLALKTLDSVPSLFPFCLSDGDLKALAGTSVQDVALSLPGTSFAAEGDILISSRGISGPAVLKLSSYAARYLSENQYKATVSVRWAGDVREDALRSSLAGLASLNASRLCSNAHPERFSARLWEHLLGRAGLRADLRWGEMGSKGLNRLVATLMSDSYEMTGKDRTQDEFVTCGGVSLSELGVGLESKAHPGLYFAGEVLDVDAVTGGFNLQAAWTTAYVAAADIFSKFENHNIPQP